MKYIGHNPNHDNSVVVLNDDGEVEFYAEAERFGDRQKQTNFLKPLIETFPNINISEEDIIVVVPGGGTRTRIIPEYDDLLVRKVYDDCLFYDGKTLRPNYVIDHHLAHAFSSWCFRTDNSERLFLAYDGAGCYACPNMKMKSSLVGVISEKEFYKIDDAFPIMSSIPIVFIVNAHGNSAGKAMGLAGYFPEVEPMQANSDNIIKILNSCLSDYNSQPQYCNFIDPNEDDLKFIASFYKFIIEQIWKQVEKNINKFRADRGVVIGGGTCLALEINTRIYNKVKGDLTFGPPINDSGLALGAAAFAYFHVNGRWPPPIKTPSLQALKKPLPKFGPQDPKEIAELLSKNTIIGLLRGKAEAGPRALGFRSILASAMKKENLKMVSEDLKGREHYRPLAPIVTEEAFDRYFVGPKGKYMQYRVECTKEAQECLPAIVHKDNSSRPQVVSKKDDPWLHDLLTEYGKLTGHPCLINTSLNAKNKSICNSFEDAIEDFKGKNIELISIKN